MLLGPGGAAKISDFGLARVVGTAGFTRASSARGGTAGYMAREFVVLRWDAARRAKRRLRRTDFQRGDVFALGCCLYHVLSGGRHPFGDYPCEYEMRIMQGAEPELGAVPKLGCAATLTCVDAGDLSRDILKSDTAYVAIPELDLELAHGSLGSVYTTVEGCLEKIVASLRRGNPFQGGDSADGAKKAHFDAFIDKIIALKDGRTFPFTIVMRDPLANSFVGPRRDAAANHGPLDAVGDGALPEDPQLVVADYARSWDEDEELGLHDIDTGDGGGGLGAIPEEGGDDDLPDVDDVDTVAVPSNLGTDFHVKPTPRRTVDHPNPTFARGCDDGAPAAQ